MRFYHTNQLHMRFYTCTTLIKCSLFFFSWVGLVSKNYEIERACVELEKEVTSIEQKKAKVKLLGLKSFSYSNFLQVLTVPVQLN